MNEPDNSEKTTDSSAQARRRRRPRRPIMVDNSVPSPCQSICRFDGQPYCVGCFRDVDEIRDWMIMTREQKLEVIARLPDRRRAAKE